MQCLYSTMFRHNKTVYFLDVKEDKRGKRIEVTEIKEHGSRPVKIVIPDLQTAEHLRVALGEAIGTVMISNELEPEKKP